MNKGFRFFISLMLVITLVCGALGSFAEGTLDTLLPDVSLEEGSVIYSISLPGEGTTEGDSSYTAGSVVTFGRYPQTAEGTDETPIEWIVLEVDEENHRALLLSKYGLDTKPYNTEQADVTWETCGLRTWLNDDFLNRAFTAEEQSAILLTDVDNSDAQGYSEWNTSGGNNTQDKIFLLSYAEAKRYFNVEHYSVSGSDQNIAARVATTAYAIRQGAWTESSDKTADGSAAVRWWLRSPGDGQNDAAYVEYCGVLNYSDVITAPFCVRPALWISLESDTGTAGETSAEVPATEGTDDLDVLFPGLNLEDGSALDAISLPGEGTTEGDSSYTAGSVVTFGRYPQSEEGTDETPIEWIVLEVDEENHRALLLSKYGLDVVPYNKVSTSVTWENCSLRPWLNQDFLSKAFSREEQDTILFTEVDNSDAQGYGEWHTAGGNNTQDKIFLLSYAEAYRYLNVTYRDSDNIAARVAPTEYAIEQGASNMYSYKTADGSAAGWWWLRSPGHNQDSAACVALGGSIRSNDVGYSDVCIRPAFWINLESDIFQSDGPASGTDQQADTEPFVFRNGITWGMAREEVVGREDSEYNEAEINGYQGLHYASVQISKYSGELDFIFSGNALQLCGYALYDADQDTFDYLLTAYDSKYGEHREADLQELYEIVLRINPEAPPMESGLEYTVCRWDTADGTAVWMLWLNNDHYLYIYYVSPAFLNPPEEGPDMTGI